MVKLPTDGGFQAFLCYSKGDKASARRLYEKLSADGFSCWFDEESIPPGADWRQEISKAVRESTVVLVCLSKSSITKVGFVQKEIEFALDRAGEMPEGRVYIIPVKFEECDVPDRLSKWQWVDLFAENGYLKLKRALGILRNSRADSQSRDQTFQISDSVTDVEVNRAYQYLSRSQADYLPKAISLRHACFVKVESTSIERMALDVEQCVRDLGYRPSTIRYSDVRLGEIRTFATAVGPKVVVVVLLDEPFFGHGCAFMKSLSVQRSPDLPLPNGIHIEVDWERVQSVVAVVENSTIRGLADKDRNSFLEYYVSA